MNRINITCKFRLNNKQLIEEIDQDLWKKMAYIS